METQRKEDSLKIYGRLPSRDHLLGHQLEDRKYFDSGDFALSQAHRPSSIGAISTGSQHPRRETVPQPFCPVPSQSNVDEGANKGLQGAENESDTENKSHLCEMTDQKTENPLEKPEKTTEATRV
ncbi:hypothetical protein TRIATDRAFT_94369 [Trichoderma atroviride IMI 206040]|uniref:mRNA stability protein n=1 Tax=Hypocrea atroviridis (strain ATCC 20476 / IMI 206040) TaxID=452589 RepID=G9NDX8_HYPAI|nr:uncharacterized protein TRIATDRAFT_94369 [Trichoderma atroviride IMI 206040]EHK51148.1 hypothetical protein TRIATDRAFT_94369 [Trichoderma atroviride IMI 206040]